MFSPSFLNLYSHPLQGEKNHGFEVLYHSVKQGPISTKELADFIRERATIEETYSKAMAKLSKLASNGTPMGTFAPLWEVFRVSSDKLALCHLELTRKLQDLIKDVLRYGEEQLKTHKKCKEEVVGTLDAVQVLSGVSQLLPKSRENYLNRCMDQERLRRESTSQKEMDKAETKTKKAAESLRRSVEKYNSARADFEQKMLDSALRFQAMEETHLRHMKALLGSYAHSVEDTHVQIGQVHEEFKQNIENVSVEMLLRKFAESKGTGREKPGESGQPLGEAHSAQVPPNLSSAMKRLRGAKAFRLPGLSRREREPEPPAAVDFLEPDSGTCPEVDEEGFTVRPDVTQNNILLPSRFSSSDSDFDDEEPRKFYVHIKPAPARAPACSPEAAAAQLRATAGSLILPPGPGGTMKRHSSRDAAGKPQRPRSAPRTSSCAERLQSEEQLSKNLFGPPLESAFDHEDFTGSSSLGFTSSPSPFSSSSPENVEDSGLDSPSHAAPGPSPDSWVPRPGTPQSPPSCRAPPPEARGIRAPPLPDSPQPLASSPGPWGLEALAGGDLMPAPADPTAREGLAAPPRRLRSRKVSCPLTRSNGDLELDWGSPLGSAFGTALERPSFLSQTGHGVSRGPSPVVLGSQDALPIATAFTEYVHAYFRGHSPSCLARVTGELTMTFPAGIVRVFSGTPPPPVLSFRLVHTTPIEHFQPNADLLFSDPSQSDPETKDFWLNMAALTEALQRQAEQNPTASYYNVVLLRYQFSRPGPQSVPLQLSAHWQCGATLTQVSVEYGYRPGATAVPTPLTNVQILLPVGELVTNVRLQPAATWNLEEKRLTWRLPDVSEAGGSGRLSASWEPLSGPSTPSPVAAQFTSEGTTLSGVDLELVGSGYRMSLVKRRFATGTPQPCCWVTSGAGTLWGQAPGCGEGLGCGDPWEG
uniref:FCH and mu domain containing endocytic adaptor 1 n=1 Tax=Pan troglodytes TaxID=9598 RepID=A0A2I3TCR7_PANTR